MRTPAVNSHIHLPPNFSAFDSVEQAVNLAADQGLRALGVSNYYDYSVYRDFSRLAVDRNIYPLFGIEIIALLPDLQDQGVKLNDPGNPGKMYICGKGITNFDPLSVEADSLLQVIRDKDSTRMAEMTERMTETFRSAGLELDLNEEEVKDRIVRRHGCPREAVYLQERHIAQAFQEDLFERIPIEERADALAQVFGAQPQSRPDDGVGIQNEIRSRLMKSGKPAYVEETFVDFDHAYRLILALGGIPCYPVLADGAYPICEYERNIDRLIESTKARGVFAVEFIPIRNSPDTLGRYVKAIRDAGMVITAGTEHNTLDLIAMEPTCLNGEPVPKEIKEVFWEGASVVAGHQEAIRIGEPGFVDANGTPSQGFRSTEDRIKAFRAIGEEAIGRQIKKME